MYPISVQRTSSPPTKDRPPGFHYVDQGNYLTLPVTAPLSLYSDSATSCIITIVCERVGDQEQVTLAHLDSPGCITAFFDVIRARGGDGVQVFAQGANPPDNQTAQQNAAALRAELATLKPAHQELFLLEGDPRDGNRGDFGIIAGPAGATVSNQQYVLALTDRDPTCGGQTVYCIMRRQEDPPVEIRDAGQPFAHAELVELSRIALAFQKTPGEPSTRFTSIVTLDSETIRSMWSTTPEFEAPWFSDQLKLGAAFALSMAPVVQLSADTLCGTRFARLGASLERGPG